MPEEGVEQGRAVLRGSRRASRDRHARRRPSSRAISLPTSRRPRWSRGWQRSSCDTAGDLKEVAKALVTAPEAWTPPPTKLKRPSEWIVGVRARHRHHRRSIPSGSPQAQALLGEPLWRPPAPKGFADDEASLDRRHGAAARRRQQLCRARRRAASIRKTSSRPCSDRCVSAETRAGGRRAPKAASRRWRCCSWRPEFQRR